MSDAISADQAQEYREVAAIVCLDIDVLADIAEWKDMTLERLQAQVRHLKETKEKTISDPEGRRKRYASLSWLFSLAASGGIQDTLAE
jgi:hypothetical protein